MSDCPRNVYFTTVRYNLRVVWLLFLVGHIEELFVGKYMPKVPSKK